MHEIEGEHGEFMLAKADFTRSRIVSTGIAPELVTTKTPSSPLNSDRPSVGCPTGYGKMTVPREQAEQLTLTAASPIQTKTTAAKSRAELLYLRRPSNV